MSANIYLDSEGISYQKLAFVPWNSRPLDEWRQIYAKGEFLSLGGRSTHYLEKGKGDPIILIHGFNMDLNTWMFNIDALAEHHRVLALDLWGLGYSSREFMDYGYALYVDQLLAFMQALDLQKASLIGHSMGGGTAIKFCLNYRHMIDKLILVDSTGIPNPLPFRSKLFTLPGVGERLLRINNNYLRRKNLEDIWFYDKGNLTEETFVEITQFQKIRGTSEILLEILRKQFFHTLEADIHQLGDLDIPTLIVWGRHDASIPLEIGREIGRIVKGSRFEIINKGGHMPNFDCADEFNRLVLEFL